jgi:FkbM family methyltransferase
MLGKIARKVYRLLVKRPLPTKTTDPVAVYEDLTKRSAPDNYGVREEYPALPAPFAPHSTGIPLYGTTALTQLYTGQKMFVDTRDLSLAPHLIVDGLWEAHVTRAIATLLQEDDVFFDVGANLGYYSCIAATRLTMRKRHITIHAFEPNPDLVELMRKTFTINGIEDAARITAAGVGDKPGELTLHRNDELWGSSSFRAELSRTKKANDITVPVITLDSYCKAHKIEKVDVVKLDVEGYEDHVYAGMRHTVTDNPGLRLVLEFTFGAYENEQDFFAQLRKDFAYIYYIDPRGEFEYISDLDMLRSKTREVNVMIVLTNKELV